MSDDDNLNDDDAHNAQQQKDATDGYNMDTATEDKKRKQRPKKQKLKTKQEKVGRLIYAYAIKTIRQEIQKQVLTVIQISHNK